MPQTPMQPEQKLLDTELALSQVGDEGVLHDMLGMLQESLARDVPDISQLLARGEVDSANRLLHAIKGFIPIFCNAGLCSEVERVELMSKPPHSAELPVAYAALRPRLEQLQAEVVAHLSGSASA